MAKSAKPEQVQRRSSNPGAPAPANLAVPVLSLISLLVFAAPLVAGSMDPSPAGALAAYIMGIGGGLFVACCRLGRPMRLPLILWPLLAFTILQAVSVLFSVNRDLSLKSLSLTLAALVLVVLLGADPVRARAPGKAPGDPAVWPCAALAAVMLWEAVVGLREYAANFRVDLGARIFATFFNPDVTAGFFCIALPVTLSLLWLDLPPGLTPLLTITTILGAAAMALTGSKGGWLCLIAGGVVMSIVRSRVRGGADAGNHRVTLAAGLSALAAAACSPLLLHRIASADASQAHSTLFRLYAWKSALLMMIHRPLLGFGPGVFAEVYPRFATAGPTEMAHSSYLQAGAESGVLGLLLLLAATWTPILRLVRLRPSVLGDGAETRGPDGKLGAGSGLALAPGLAGGLAASCLHNWIDFDWGVPAVWLVFWAIAGAAAALLNRAGPPPGRETAGSRPPTRALPEFLKGRSLLGIGIALLAAAALTLCSAVASNSLDQARAALGIGAPGSDTGQSGDAAKAAELASTAVSLDPLDPEARVVRGEARQAIGGTDGGSALEDAADDYRAAHRLAPQWERPLYLLGKLQLSWHEPDAADRSLRESLQHDPHILDAQLYLAAIANARNHTGEARSWLQTVADTESTPFATVRGVPEDFDSHYLQAWVSLAELDAGAGRWRAVESESRHALTDLDLYSQLALKYVYLQRVWPVYAPSYRRSMVDLQASTSRMLENALGHLGRKAEIPEVEARQRAFAARMAAIKDPPPDPGQGSPAD